MPKPDLPELGEAFKYIPANDAGIVENFFRVFVNSTFRFDPEHGLNIDGPLYHYTSGEGLIGIVKSQELWGTQVSCLNDTTEFAYAAAELLKRVRARVTVQCGQPVETFLNRLSDYLEDPRPDTAFAFVTCFSEQRDDLSQWRAYAGGEAGYAIEFDPVKLYESATDGESTAQILMRVVYDQGAQVRMLDELLAKGERLLTTLSGAKTAPSPNWAHEFARYWLGNLIYMAPCIKHPTFASEREWRLVYYLKPNDFTRMHFRQRQSMMTRHVPLLLKKPLPISGVLVGPCRHPHLSKIAVGDLLKQNGCDPDVVKVSLSAVPYRTV